MFNPFVPLQYKMIKGFRKMKHRYIVSQTIFDNEHVINNSPYLKGNNGSHDTGGAAKECLLFSDYAELSSAQIHFNALNDKYRAILDLENEKHRRKAIEMIGSNSTFRVYVAFVEDIRKIEKDLNKKYSSSIRNYISKRTSWRITAQEAVNAKLELIFGELFVILKYRSHTERLRLAELEKF